MRYSERALPALVLLMVLTACQPQRNAYGDLPVDLEAAKIDLMETDMAWATAASAFEDLELIASYWTEGAMVMGSGSPTVVGKEAIRQMLAGSAEIPGFHIAWEPDGVEVGPSGRMGYTWGRNRVTLPDQDGNLATTEGRYLTVWRMNLDGEWKCAMDIWTDDPGVAPTLPDSLASADPTAGA
jgi:ketosteroid isomerase-like protein